MLKLKDIKNAAEDIKQQYNLVKEDYEKTFKEPFYTFDEYKKEIEELNNKNKFSMFYETEAHYFSRNGYRDYGNNHWTSYKPSDSSCEYKQGWKSHICIEDQEKYYEAMRCLLPELKRLNINHKVISPDYRPGQEMSDTQRGKTIAIYEADLTFVQDLNDEAKAFISEMPEYDVPTDYHIGGRMFARYTNSRYDLGIDPVTGDIEKIERVSWDKFVQDPENPEKTFYSPSFIPDPPSLSELFEMDKKIEGGYQAHRESLKFYLARTGDNNELLKEMLGKSLREYAKEQINDPWIDKEIKYEEKASIKEKNYKGQTLLDVAIENGNLEIVKLLGGKIQQNHKGMENEGVKNIKTPHKNYTKVTRNAEKIKPIKKVSSKETNVEREKGFSPLYEKAKNLSDKESMEFISKRFPAEKALKEMSEEHLEILLQSAIYLELSPKNNRKEAVEMAINDYSKKKGIDTEKAISKLNIALGKEKKCLVEAAGENPEKIRVAMDSSKKQSQALNEFRFSSNKDNKLSI